MDAAVLPAPPALSFRVRGTGAPVRLQPSWQIGNGGEARVYALPAAEGAAPLVAKVHHVPSDERGRKLTYMVANPPGVPNPGAPDLAWPLELLEDDAGQVRGFVMRRAEGARLFDLYNPATRRQRAPHADYQTLLHAGRALASVFERLHAGGYVVGDVNESNILVGEWGWVTVVDTDSFQVREPDGIVHRSRVGKPEFTPPELQGMPFDEVDRGPEHDGFGLAVLLFQLLMEGTHPFAAQYPGLPEMPAMEWRIREGRFPYRGILETECSPPRLAPPIHLLHPALRSLFHRCFVDGAGAPHTRPTAPEWRRALETAAGALVTCRQNRRHKYGDHLRQCPWCERAALLGGRDPFPLPGAPDVLPKPQAPPHPGQAVGMQRPPVPGMAVPPPPPPPTPAVGGRPPQVHIPTGAVPGILSVLPDDLRPVTVCAIAVGLSLILPFPFGMALGFALAGAVAEHVFPRPRQAMTALAIGVVILFVLKGLGGLFLGADEEDDRLAPAYDVTDTTVVTAPPIVAYPGHPGVATEPGLLVVDLLADDRLLVEREGAQVAVPLDGADAGELVENASGLMINGGFPDTPVQRVELRSPNGTRQLDGPFDSNADAVRRALELAQAGTADVDGDGGRPALRNETQVKRISDEIYRETLEPRGLGGTVWLNVQVDRFGMPATVEVARSGNPELDPHALEVGRRMRFRPGMDAYGEPVAVTMEVPVVFQP
jgi:TonB family protein